MESQHRFQQTRTEVLVASQATDHERVDFIKNTYWHVAFAVALFIMVEMLFLNTPFIVNIGLSMTQGWTWLLVLGGFMFATSAIEGWATRSTDRNHQYIALFLYVIAEAFIFVPLIYIAWSVAGDSPALLAQAGIVTIGLFTGLSAVALLTKKDFSFLKSILTIGTIVAIAAIVGGIAFGFNLGLFFSVAMVALAAGSILYQTSNMVHVYRTDQYVAASLGLFAALMLLFWYILSILLRFAGSD